MNKNAPIALVAAGYDAREAALEDFTTVWSSRYEGDFHHTSVAVLTRDSDREFRVERHSSTAKHLIWGGALLGGPLLVVAPAAGTGMLATAGLTGAGAIIGHVYQNTHRDDLARLADLLDEATWGLVVVVVNRRGEVVVPLLAHAGRSSSVDLLWGDLEEELCQDFARPLSGLTLVAS
jgi:hypothetical protein